MQAGKQGGRQAEHHAGLLAIHPHSKWILIAPKARFALSRKAAVKYIYDKTATVRKAL